jgi:hypothetical protein
MSLSFDDEEALSVFSSYIALQHNLFRGCEGDTALHG